MLLITGSYPRTLMPGRATELTDKQRIRSQTHAFASDYRQLLHNESVAWYRLLDRPYTSNVARGKHILNMLQNRWSDDARLTKEAKTLDYISSCSCDILVTETERKTNNKTFCNKINPSPMDTLLCSCDLDLDPITLIYTLDPDHFEDVPAHQKWTF